MVITVVSLPCTTYQCGSLLCYRWREMNELNVIDLKMNIKLTVIAIQFICLKRVIF